MYIFKLEDSVEISRMSPFVDTSYTWVERMKARVGNGEVYKIIRIIADSQVARLSDNFWYPLSSLTLTEEGPSTTAPLIGEAPSTTAPPEVKKISFDKEVFSINPYSLSGENLLSFLARLDFEISRLKDKYVNTP